MLPPCKVLPATAPGSFLLSTAQKVGQTFRTEAESALCEIAPPMQRKRAENVGRERST